MQERYRRLVADEFRDCVNRTITRITNNERTYRPFHSALLSEEVIFWSAFERSFSTSFGQRVIEEIAKIVALANGADAAERQVETIIRIDRAHEQAIHEHIQSLRNGDRRLPYDWDTSLREVLDVVPTGRLIERRIISDLWWRKNGIDHFVSLKTVKPNIDQTAIAKEDCLHLSVADPDYRAYFGLPYNPYGEDREDYAFNPPKCIFDINHDPVVLIGWELWDTIGGRGCYEELLDIAQQVGTETQAMINAIDY